MTRVRTIFLYTGLIISGLFLFGILLHIFVAQSLQAPEEHNPSIPEAVSVQEPAPILQPTSVHMLFFGDMMLDRNVAAVMGKEGLPVVLGDFVSSSKELFDAADIVSVNLEGPLAAHRIETSKEIAFRFDPSLAPQLAEHGFTIVTLANNHTNDMGSRAAEETVQHLTDVGIDSYGSQYVVTSSSLHYEQVEGMQIAFVGVNDTHPHTPIEKAIQLVEEAEGVADVTVLNIHWGIEYKELSSMHQRTLAYRFIDAGVDIIIGHHPHVVQEIEVYNGKPIFYSLGNFIFDQYFSIPTQQSLGVSVQYEETGAMQISLIPLKGQRSVVAHMTTTEATPFMQALFDRSRLGPYTFDHMYSFRITPSTTYDY